MESILQMHFIKMGLTAKHHGRYSGRYASSELPVSRCLKITFLVNPNLGSP